MDYEGPTRQIQLAPAPNQIGYLDLVYVAQGDPLGAYLDTVSPNVDLTVPDEFASAVKYGVLADAFGKDGRGKDPQRAAYCEQRYQLAQQVAEIILNGWV
jgi:hypothetical protein